MNNLYKYIDEYFLVIKEINSIDSEKNILLNYVDSSNGEIKEKIVSSALFNSKFKKVDFRWPLKLYDEKLENYVDYLGTSDSPLKAEYGKFPEDGAWGMDVDINLISHHYYDHLDKRQWYVKKNIKE
jgi:hypothetical protein